jgi:hypothetical protein
MLNAISLWKDGVKRFSGDVGVGLAVFWYHFEIELEIRTMWIKKYGSTTSTLTS